MAANDIFLYDDSNQPPLHNSFQTLSLIVKQFQSYHTGTNICPFKHQSVAHESLRYPLHYKISIVLKNIHFLEYIHGLQVTIVSQHIHLKQHFSIVIVPTVAIAMLLFKTE